MALNLDPVTLADLVDRYAADGAVVVRGVLSSDVRHTLAAAVEENMASPSPLAKDYTPEGSTGRFFADYVSWPRITGYRDAALSGALPQVAAALMQSSTARFFHEHVLVKEPGTGEVTPWHHDAPYYCVEGFQNVSLWVPLDPVPAEAGLELIAGSHRWPKMFVPKRFVDHTPFGEAGGDYEYAPDFEAHRHEYRIVNEGLEPGDVLAFHYRTVHAAPGNLGRAHRRRAVSFRFVGDDAVFATRPWEVSPPFEPFTPGDTLDDERFPLATLA